MFSDSVDLFSCVLAVMWTYEMILGNEPTLCKKASNEYKDWNWIQNIGGIKKYRDYCIKWKKIETYNIDVH